MQEKDFFQQLDEVFELDAGSIQPDVAIRELPEWDSMTFLGLIATVDEQTGVTLEPEDVLEITTARDLFNLVQQKQQQRAA